MEEETKSEEFNDLSGVCYFITINNINITSDSKKHILYKVIFNRVEEPYYSSTYYGEKYLDLATPINEDILTCEELKECYRNSNLELKTFTGSF